MSTNKGFSLDYDKPSLPYIKGFKTVIKSHTPPPPFENEYPRKIPEGAPSDFTHKNYVFEYPPLENPLDSDSSQSKVADLEIIEAIATGDSRGAQVVLCKITPPDNKCYQAVAKIYDALYYKFLGKTTPLLSDDVVFRADRDYTSEAAAYEHLQATGQTGTSAPDYFGSWTFTLPCQGPQKKVDRPIRLILMEYLNGARMIDLFRVSSSGRPNAFHYQKGFRLEVMKEVLELISRLARAGIRRSGLAPQNAMLVPRPEPHWTEAQVPRVVFIDYHLTSIDRTVKSSEGNNLQNPEKPQSPMKTFWAKDFSFFSGWIPTEWHIYGGHRKWLVDRFGANDMKDTYAPVDLTELQSANDGTDSDDVSETDSSEEDRSEEEGDLEHEGVWRDTVRAS